MALFRRSKPKTEEKPDQEKVQASSAKSQKDAAPKKPEKQQKSKRKRSGNRDQIAHRVIIRPQVTEKVARLNEMNQYVFRVHPRARKQEIAQAVQELYGVRPIRVNTIKIPGKARRLGQTQGTIPGYKKAIVTLPEGKKIEVVQH